MHVLTVDYKGSPPQHVQASGELLQACTSMAAYVFSAFRQAPLASTRVLVHMPYLQPWQRNEILLKFIFNLQDLVARVDLPDCIKRRREKRERNITSLPAT